MNHLVLTKNRRTQATLKKLNELNPWFYPVAIDGVLVCPGIDGPANISSTRLSQRILYRKHLIVDEVLSRIDVANKKVLSVACNIGYWLYHYHRRGASKVVGFEGRQHFVAQSALFWAQDKLKSPVVRGDVTDDTVLQMIGIQAPFDVCICSGLLYHLEDYAGFLEILSKLSKADVLVVDTRVTSGPERVKKEPRGAFFNSLDGEQSTKRAVTPNRERLLGTLKDLGYNTEILRPRFFMPESTKSADNYINGNRVTILAER